ncbi:phytoene/squalene synthase family protein [Kaistia adipata]|uniref:phytoene/squalene synthase family protein n=1 Tax=Kaistia adipata TaxID=166954 RepID=UPI00041C9376|nr:phytoene/squalene synthase family protein [Kaistia adipata]
MDVFALCADEVRAHDRDRFLADLFAPEAKRRYLFALHAFNIEIARVREAISGPMPGEIRLQWWRDVLSGEARGEVAGHPVAAALLETIGLHDLPRAAFDNLIAARIFDLYNDPMPSLTDLEGYAGETASALLQLAALILSEGKDPGTADAAGHAGVAQALTGLMRALPQHASRQQLFMPADLMERHGVRAEDIFAGRTTPELLRMLADLRATARRHLGAARAALAGADRAVLPAFLPVALVEPVLALMDRPDYDPFKTPVDPPQWKRQWWLWRAARKGAF